MAKVRICMDCGKNLTSHSNSLRCRYCSKKGKNSPQWKHGYTVDKIIPRIYYIWVSMKQRCYNLKCKNYKWYGGRGIKVCEEWLEFAVFRDWASANGYKEGLSIDRIDNNGNYEPSNCQWIPIIENIIKDITKPVNQFDLGGNLIAVYFSVDEAGKQTKIDVGNICKNCRNKRKMAGGYRWTYAEKQDAQIRNWQI